MRTLGNMERALLVWRLVIRAKNYIMKKTFLFIVLFLLTFTTKAQFLATVQMTDTLEGICDHDRVFALFDSFDGQETPKCSVSKKEMEKILNKDLQFLKDNPKFKGKGMVGVFINCEGLVVEWDISNKTKSSKLDEEILEIFKTMNDWTVGKLDGEEVDTHDLISYEIKKGVLKIN